MLGVVTGHRQLRIGLFRQHTPVRQVGGGERVLEIDQVVARLAHLASPPPFGDLAHLFHQAAPGPLCRPVHGQPAALLLQPFQAGRCDEGQEATVLQRPGEERNKLLHDGRLVLGVYLVEVG